MGTQLSSCKSLNLVSSQPIDVAKEINIYKWRTDPNFNEYISRTFLNQSFSNGQKIHSWANNQDYYKQFKFQKYICNLDMLQKSLNFQDCVYIIKGLMLGYEQIYNFFGKAYVDGKCCFLTKEGQIRAWINPNYQSNAFLHDNLSLKQQFSYRDTTQRFMNEQQWKNSKKISMSEANIIQNVINMVSNLSKQQNFQYFAFVQKLDKFITSNILKNYNFKRVNKFINRYIYQNKVSVSLNLKAKIQEIYFNSVNKNKNKNSMKNSKSSLNLSSSKSISNKIDHDLHQSVAAQSSHMKNIMLNQQSDLFKKKSSLLQSQKSTLKNSERFCNLQKQKQYHSTANSSHGFMTDFKRGNEHSHTQYYPVNGLNEKNYHFQNRYMIQPQFSINLLNQSHQRSISQMDKKSVSFHTPKSSILSNKSSFKIKNLDFRSIYDKDLGIIAQKKQTQQSQANDSLFNNLSFNPKTQIITNQKSPEPIKRTSIISQISSKSNNTFKNYQNKQNKLQISDFGKKIFKNSTTSIHNNYPEENPKMFKSNCLQNRSSLLHDNTYTAKKYDEDREKSQFQFTVKTITRLISNDEELEEHYSQGQFSSSHLNQSTYSGVLASMGRSAHLQQLPKKEMNNNFKKSQRDIKNYQMSFKKDVPKSHQHFD